MKRLISLAAFTMLSACMGGGDGGGGVTLVPIDPSFAPSLNGVRASAGAGPVSYDERLHTAAQLHANDMLENDYFSHTGLNGSSPGDRIKDQGYNLRAYGENIAKGQRTEAEALDSWVNSPGHQANNINPAFEDFALAKAGSGSNTYWVLVLASEF